MGDKEGLRMEMEKTVMELVGGLKWEILFMLFQCMLVGYIILTIKAFIVNEFAYRKFRNSLFISVGTSIRCKHIDRETKKVYE